MLYRNVVLNKSSSILVARIQLQLLLFIDQKYPYGRLSYTWCHLLPLIECTQPARAPLAHLKSDVWRGASPVDPTTESSSLGSEEDFFSAIRIRTCSRTLLALATGSGDGPSEGTTYVVQDVLGCRADRKQPSPTATLILRRERTEFTRIKSEMGLIAAGAARPAARSVVVSAAKWRSVSNPMFCRRDLQSWGWPKST